MGRKKHLALKPHGLRFYVMALACWLALSGFPMSAHAAGFGRVLVLSGLGQPLRAEIEVAATHEELADMKARLAPKEVFQQAGLDYVSSLQSLYFSIEQRDNRQAVIKMFSTTPINEPFIDMLLEINWSTGRLVREFTFLLDPAEAFGKNAALPGPVVVNLPELPVVSPAASGTTATPVNPVADESGEKVLAAADVSVQGAHVKHGESTAETKTLREVKRGDTLSKIARSIKPEGVSLEQMLVGLFRANQDAFDGANMNRLRAGKVLVIVGQPALEAISPAAAKKVVVAQSADWNAYRGKLAAMAAQMPVNDASGKQDDAGKITARVDEKALASAAARDQLRVSATDVVGAAAKNTEEDMAAKEKALKEANERLVLLEKNVANLQKLLDLKNQNSAETQPLTTDKPAQLKMKKAVEIAKTRKKQKPRHV